MYYETLCHCLRCCPDRLSIDMTTVCSSASTRRKGHLPASERGIVDLLQVDHVNERQVFVAIFRRGHCLRYCSLRVLSTGIGSNTTQQITSENLYLLVKWTNGDVE